MISSNIKSLQRSLDKKLKKTRKIRDKNMATIVNFAYNRILKLSPVDTGLFRASNIISINKITKWTANPNAINSGLSNNMANAFTLYSKRFKDGDSIIIQNHLEYAEALEAGHSRQAQEGIYKRAEAETKRKFGL